MKNKVFSLLAVLAFFGFLALFGIMGLVIPDEQLGISENRALAQKPVNDLSDLSALTGAYGTYVTDQFPFRENILQYHTELQLMLGKNYVKNTYVCPDGTLLTRSFDLSPDTLQDLCTALTHLTRSAPQVDFAYAILPIKNAMVADPSAPFMDTHVDENNRQMLVTAFSQIPSLETLDIAGNMLESFSLTERQQLYFRTDFHWNSKGAFLAAQCMGEKLADAVILDRNILPQIDDFLWSDLGKSHDYAGDLNRRFMFRFSQNEDIPFYCLKDASAVEYYSSLGNSLPIERSELLAANLDTHTLDYAGLSTENKGYYRIENPNARSPLHVVILKDSYQNPTTDYFTELFSQVTVIDPRSYHEAATITELLEQEKIDLVLFMYHQNNVNQELIDFLNNK